MKKYKTYEKIFSAVRDFYALFLLSIGLGFFFSCATSFVAPFLPSQSTTEVPNIESDAASEEQADPELDESPELSTPDAASEEQADPELDESPELSTPDAASEEQVSPELDESSELSTPDAASEEQADPELDESPELSTPDAASEEQVSPEFDESPELSTPDAASEEQVSPELDESPELSTPDAASPPLLSIPSLSNIADEGNERAEEEREGLETNEDESLALAEISDPDIVDSETVDISSIPFAIEEGGASLLPPSSLPEFLSQNLAPLTADEEELYEGALYEEEPRSDFEESAQEEVAELNPSQASVIPDEEVSPAVSPEDSPAVSRADTEGSEAAPAESRVDTSAPPYVVQETPSDDENSDAGNLLDAEEVSDETSEYLIVREGEEFTVVLSGTGWTYLGVSKEGVNYSRVLQEGGNNQFIFFAAESDSFELAFERFDLSKGTIQGHTVFLTVSPSTAAVSDVTADLEADTVTRVETEADIPLLRTLLAEEDIDGLVDSLSTMGDLSTLDSELLFDISEAFLMNQQEAKAAELLSEVQGVISDDHRPRLYYLLGMLNEQFHKDIERALFYYDLILARYLLSTYHPLAEQRKERIERYYLNIR